MTKEFIDYYSKNIANDSKDLRIYEFLDGLNQKIFLWLCAQINKKD